MLNRIPAGDAHGFTWLSQLPGHLPGHVVHLLAVSFLLIFMTAIARWKLSAVASSAQGGIVPPPRLNFLNFFDIISEKLYNLTSGVLGEDGAKRFFPIIGFIFLFIFTSNLMGSIPGFSSPTDNLNTTFAFGIFVFGFYNWTGFREHGFGYIKQFLGPVWWLAPLMLIIELISHVVRPVTLGIRLRTNIFADHLVLSTFSDLVPLVLPMVFIAFGLFVAFVQALVFTLLTMVYISLATSHDH